MNHHGKTRGMDTSDNHPLESWVEGPGLDSLEKKIHALFNYRMFPRLLELIKKGEGDKNEFYQRLVSLQAAIYFLDAHLEKNWVIDEDKRTASWKDIYSFLAPFLSPGQNPEDYVHHIKKYEKHEMAIRRMIWPSRYKMEYFYFYKSCDVKLLRRLIYEYGDLSPSVGSLSEWRYFDFITEVNDDVVDVYEDMPLYNGNRFLIHLLKDGKNSTSSLYLNFIQEIEKMARSKRAQSSKKAWTDQIFQETMVQCMETREKIHEIIDSLDLSVLKKESALSVYLGV